MTDWSMSPLLVAAVVGSLGVAVIAYKMMQKPAKRKWEGEPISFARAREAIDAMQKRIVEISGDLIMDKHGLSSKADLLALLAEKGVLEDCAVCPWYKVGQQAYYTLEDEEGSTQEHISTDEFLGAFSLESLLLELFHVVSVDGSGQVATADLRYILVAHPETMNLMRQCDANPEYVLDHLEKAATVQVDVHLFMRLLSANQRVVSLFNKCDRNGDGVVSKAELATVLQTDDKAVALLVEADINMPTGTHAAFLRPHVVFEQLDLNRNDMITLNEFMTALRGLKRSTRARVKPRARPLRSTQGLGVESRHSDGAEVLLRDVGYSKSGEKVFSAPAFYTFLGMDLVQSENPLERVAERVQLMVPPVRPPAACDVPGVIVANMQIPRDTSGLSLLSQNLRGPTANAIMYFGIKPETAQALEASQDEWPNALRLLNRYWAEFEDDRKLQETLKLIAICKNPSEVGGKLLSMGSSYNGKPVLITGSGTVYKGVTPENVSYGGIDVNMRCWARLARMALVKCCYCLPQAVTQVAFTIEGDHKKRGGAGDLELPEQVFGSCECWNVPDVVTCPLFDEYEFFNPPESE